jgi:hypothetical protein
MIGTRRRSFLPNFVHCISQLENCLFQINGDRDADEVFFNLASLFDHMFFGVPLVSMRWWWPQNLSFCIRPHQFNSLDSGCAKPRRGGRRKIKKGVKKKFHNFFWGIQNSLLNNFIHFQLQNNAPIWLQIPSKVKVTLGKIMLFFFLFWNTWCWSFYLFF